MLDLTSPAGRVATVLFLPAPGPPVLEQLERAAGGAAHRPGPAGGAAVLAQRRGVGDRVDLAAHEWVGVEEERESAAAGEGGDADDEAVGGAAAGGVSEVAGDGGEDGAARDGGGDGDGGGLGVRAHAAQRLPEDEGEERAFAEEGHDEHGEAGGTGEVRGERGEQDGADVEEGDEMARFEDEAEAGADEAGDGKGGVGDGEVVRGVVGGVGGGEVDAEGCRVNFLATDVAELAEDAKGERDPDDGNVVPSGGVGAVQSFTCVFELAVRGFREWDVVVCHGQQDRGQRDAKICPLRVHERGRVGRPVEEGFVGDQGRHDTADSLHALTEVEADLGILGSTTQRNEGIGGDFQNGQANCNDKVGDDEGRKRSQNSRGPEDHGAARVDGQPDGKAGFEAPPLQHPVSDRQGPDEISRKICTMAAGVLARRPLSDALELLIQHREQAVFEAPDEEQDGDHGDRKNGFAIRHVHHAFLLVQFHKVEKRRFVRASVSSGVGEGGVGPLDPGHARRELRHLRRGQKLHHVRGVRSCRVRGATRRSADASKVPQADIIRQGWEIVVIWEIRRTARR
nr:hypothetical protein CFP56_52488 [Quercus suber]